jgi:hypothetical protein
MVSVVQTAGPAFGTNAVPRTATTDFASDPAAGRLVIMGFGGDKNSLTLTPPAGITVPTNGALYQTDCSAVMGYGSGVDGGNATWTGQAGGCLAFFELDAGAGWSHRLAAQATTGAAAALTVALAGTLTSPVDGVAIALVSTDSSTGTSGPFADANTVGFSNGFTVVGRYREAAPYTNDAGGASFVLGIKDLTSGDRTYHTTFTTSAGADQLAMIVEVIDIAAAVGQPPGRQLISY